MPLGYVKGQTYCQNWDFDRYAAMPIFKLLSDYARKLKLSLHFTYSHITRAYDCEIRQICYFKHSGNPYWLGLANRGGDTPIEALINALSVVAPSTPLLQVLILEAQCVLLGEDLERSRKLEEKLNKLLDDLRWIMLSVNVPTADYECENCIGMIEHGCYCKSQGCPAPGVPAPEWDRSKEIIPKADVARVIAPLTVGIPAAPGEDDDL